MEFIKRWASIIAGNLEHDDDSKENIKPNIPSRINNTSATKTSGQLNKKNAEIMAPQWLKIMQDCVNLVNETTTPKVFFERYNLLIETLENLSQIESCVIFKKQPSVDLKNVIALRVDATNDFIDRYANKILCELQGLISDKAKAKRLEIFANAFSVYHLYLTESNQNKIDDCFDNLLFEANISNIGAVPIPKQETTNARTENQISATHINSKKELQSLKIFENLARTNQNLKRRPGSFNWNIMVSFGKSNSGNYDKAKFLAQNSIKYESQEIDGNVINTAMFNDSRDSFIDFINLYEIVSGWKSTACFINGKLVDKKTVGKIKYCYGDKCRSVKYDFCYGASIMTDNPFGCHRLQISRFNNPWWGYYKLEGNHYVLDRHNLLERIKFTEATFKYCPAFDFEYIENMAMTLPLALTESDYHTIIEKVNMYDIPHETGL